MTAIVIYKNILRYNILPPRGEKLQQGHDMIYVFSGSFGVRVDSDDVCTEFYRRGNRARPHSEGFYKINTTWNLGTFMKIFF